MVAFIMEFKEFDSIEVLESLVIISEKIHGTNARIAIDDQGKELKAGSRTRWITPEDDNYGFASWAYSNKDALITLLGPGRHYGEWYGAGIGPGYGLREKRFALFNTHRWTQAVVEDFLPRIDVVPILYLGTFTPNIVRDTMESLKKNGSSLVPGFMRPEGVVTYFPRTETYFKQVFDKEDMGWDRKDKKTKVVGDPVLEAKVLSYLQPVRLEKLIMRDDRYLRDYPKTLPNIVKDYVSDLVKESEPIDPRVLTEVRNKAFDFIRERYGK